MPGLPRFCPCDGFLLSSCCRRRTQRWMNDSMPCTHLNLICVILCRKKFRDHNEITRLKMINRIEQFFLYLHKLNQFIRKRNYMCRGQMSRYYYCCLRTAQSVAFRLEWTNVRNPIVRQKHIHRLYSSIYCFVVRCQSAAGTISPLHNSIRRRAEQNLFLICLNLKWIAKISDNENPSFMRRYRLNAPSTECE